MEDISRILLDAALIGLIAFGFVLLNQLRRRLASDEQWREIMAVVEAIEQTMSAEPGQARKAEALRRIKELYPNIDAQRLETMIEAAVLTVNTIRPHLERAAPKFGAE